MVNNYIIKDHVLKRQKNLKIKQMDLCITHPSAVWENSEMSQRNYFKRKKPGGIPNNGLY